jgi:hypothetical protein
LLYPCFFVNPRRARRSRYILFRENKATILYISRGERDGSQGSVAAACPCRPLLLPREPQAQAHCHRYTLLRARQLLISIPPPSWCGCKRALCASILRTRGAVRHVHLPYLLCHTCGDPLQTRPYGWCSLGRSRTTARVRPSPSPSCGASSTAYASSSSSASSPVPRPRAPLPHRLLTPSARC